MSVQKYVSFQQLLDSLEQEKVKGSLRFLGEGITISKKEFAKKCFEKKSHFEEQGLISIGLFGGKSLELVSSFFGAVLSGLRVVIIDPMEDASSIAKMAKYAELEKVLDIDEQLEEDELEEINASLYSRKEGERESEGEGNLLFFTSGTSGPSKPVVLTSESLLDACYNGQSCLPAKEGDSVLSILPLSHVFGFVCSFLWPLCYDSSIVLGRGLKKMCEDVNASEATILTLIPTQVAFLLSRNCLNPESKTILIGAGPLSEPLIAAIKAAGKSLAFGYGLTETSSGVAISVGSDDPYAFSICPEDEFRVEEDGTLSIKTPGLMKGYYKNEEATKAAIDNGWLRTNDLGFIDEAGKLHVIGRKDDILVLSSGMKMDAGKIESALMLLTHGGDCALLVSDGAPMLVYFNIEQALLNDVLKKMNATLPLGTQIVATRRLSSPLPRTRSGKVIRYKLMKMMEGM